METTKQQWQIMMNNKKEWKTIKPHEEQRKRDDNDGSPDNEKRWKQWTSIGKHWTTNEKQWKTMKIMNNNDKTMRNNAKQRKSGDNDGSPDNEKQWTKQWKTMIKSEDQWKTMKHIENTQCKTMNKIKILLKNNAANTTKKGQWRSGGGRRRRDEHKAVRTLDLAGHENWRFSTVGLAPPLGGELWFCKIRAAAGKGGRPRRNLRVPSFGGDYPQHRR